MSLNCTAAYYQCLEIGRPLLDLLIKSMYAMSGWTDTQSTTGRTEILPEKHSSVSFALQLVSGNGTAGSFSLL